MQHGAQAPAVGAVLQFGSIGELVAQCEARMEAAAIGFGHGTLNAHDEAVWLVLWSLGLPLDDLDGVAAQRPSPADCARIEALLRARIDTRKPLAYLTQEAWLQGVSFYVDERSIIPRSLIAELIADASIDPWIHPQARRVLDLCTGNGSLAVLACMAWPDVEVDACDLSADALAVAQINRSRHGLDARIRLAQGDGLKAASGRYDLILCNPPYVNAQSMAVLPPEYRAEPALALAGGDDGMDFIRGLLIAAPSHLTDEGVLVLEIGNERPNFEAAFPALEAVWLSTATSEDGVCLLTREALESR